jgi:hypothetical protein
MHSFLIRARTWLAFVTDPVRQFLVMRAHRRDYGSQRMCPFCGLITPRSKPLCLECGRMLKGA